MNKSNRTNKTNKTNKKTVIGLLLVALTLWAIFAWRTHSTSPLHIEQTNQTINEIKTIVPKRYEETAEEVKKTHEEIKQDVREMSHVDVADGLNAELDEFLSGYGVDTGP